jgi:hypothetical protein
MEDGLMYTHKAYSQRNDAGTDSLEHQLMMAVRTLRALAAECDGDDDYFKTWAHSVLDRRPLVFIAAVMEEGQTLTWLIDPAESDAVVDASYCDLPEADGSGREIAQAHLPEKSHLLHTIEEHINWLVREKTGMFLSKRAAPAVP